MRLVTEKADFVNREVEFAAKLVFMAKVLVIGRLENGNMDNDLVAGTIVLVFDPTSNPEIEVLVTEIKVFKKTNVGEPPVLVFALSVRSLEFELLLKEETVSAGDKVEKVMFGEIVMVPLGTWLLGKTQSLKDSW